MEAQEILQHLEQYVDNVFNPRWLYFGEVTELSDIQELTSPVYNYDGTVKPMCKDLAIYLNTQYACDILSEIVRLMVADKLNYIVIFSEADTSSDLYFNYLQYGNVFFIRGKHKFFDKDQVAMQVTVLDSMKFIKRRMAHYLECPMETQDVMASESYQSVNPMKMLYGHISLSATVR